MWNSNNKITGVTFDYVIYVNLYLFTSWFSMNEWTSKFAYNAQVKAYG